MENNEQAISERQASVKEIKVAEAAFLLGYSERTIQRLAQRGIIKGHYTSTHIGQQWSLFESSVLDYKEKIKKNAEEELARKEALRNGTPEQTTGGRQADDIRTPDARQADDRRTTDDRYTSYLEKRVSDLEDDLKILNEKGTAAIEKAARLEGEQTGRDMIIGEYKKLIFNLTEKLRIAPTGDRGQPKIVEMEIEEIKEI